MNKIINLDDVVNKLTDLQKVFDPGQLGFDLINTAIESINTIPSLGLCKDCEYWEQHTIAIDIAGQRRRVPAKTGSCVSEAYDLGDDTWIETQIDHYCAAFKVRIQIQE